MQRIKHEYLALNDDCSDTAEIVRLEKYYEPIDGLDISYIEISVPRSVCLSTDKARELAAGLIQLANELEHRMKTKKKVPAE